MYCCMLDREGFAAVLYTQAASQNAHLVPPKYGLPLSENEGVLVVWDVTVAAKERSGDQCRARSIESDYSGVSIKIR
jgi:hypothetical protein